MSVSVRRATAADGKALYGAWEALRHHYAAVDRRIVPTPVAEDEFIADLQQMLAHDASVAFVAEADGRVVGFLSGGIEQNQPGRMPERHATIGYMYVEPACRRQGVGRCLYEAMSEWAGRHGDIAHLEMVVPASDEEALPFWRSLGFRPFLERLWAPLREPGDEP